MLSGATGTLDREASAAVFLESGDAKRTAAPGEMPSLRWWREDGLLRRETRGHAHKRRARYAEGPPHHVPFPEELIGRSEVSPWSFIEEEKAPAEEKKDAKNETGEDAKNLLGEVRGEHLLRP